MTRPDHRLAEEELHHPCRVRHPARKGATQETFTDFREAGFVNDLIDAMLALIFTDDILSMKAQNLWQGDTFVSAAPVIAGSFPAESDY